MASINASIETINFGGIQLSLGFNINKKETAYNANKFLLNDFERYLSFSGTNRSLISSPTFSLEPIARSSENGQEHKVMKIIEAQQTVVTVVETINACSSSPSEPYKQILKFKYLDKLKNWEVSQKIGFGTTRYKELKDNALCEFADRLEFYAMRNKVDLPDLHIYKN